MNHEGDRLLTVHEVAAYLRIDPESIRRWLRDGKLLGINLGRGSGWRIRTADLQGFLADHHTNNLNARSQKLNGSPQSAVATDGQPARD